MVYNPYKNDTIVIRYSSNLMTKERAEELKDALGEMYSIDIVKFQTSKPGTKDLVIVSNDADVSEVGLKQFLKEFVFGQA